MQIRTKKILFIKTNWTERDVKGTSHLLNDKLFHLLNWGCAPAQRPVCWRSRGNSAHNPVCPGLRLAQMGRAGPENEATVSCWSARGERPTPTASGWPVQPGVPRDHCPHCPLSGEVTPDKQGIQTCTHTRHLIVLHFNSWDLGELLLYRLIDWTDIV